VFPVPAGSPVAALLRGDEAQPRAAREKAHRPSEAIGASGHGQRMLGELGPQAESFARLVLRPLVHRPCPAGTRFTRQL
jgi:hypothetical protein